MGCGLLAKVTLPLNPASRVWPDWPRDVLIIPEIYEERRLPTMKITPAQAAIFNIDPTALSLDGLLVHYNELVDAFGVGDKRNAKFRDKPTGHKAIAGLITQIASTPDEDNAVTPGLARLRAAPGAKALRTEVLGDQARAAALATRGRDAAPPALETDPVPVAAPRKRAATLADTTVITVVSTTNPKRPGSAAHARFALYRSGQTVAQFATAVGDRTAALRDIDWDAKHGFISVK